MGQAALKPMGDALDLKGLRLVAIHPAIPHCGDVTAQVRRVEVEANFDPSACPECGSESLYRHGVRQQKYADAPHYGEPTVLLVNRRRWRCRNCKTLFPDPLPDVDETRRATRRLIQFVKTRSLEYTFASIGRDVGLSDVSVRHIFDDLVTEMEAKYKFATPRYLGIDEVKIVGDYRCILTNVERNTVYDFLVSRGLDFLRDYFKTFPNRKDVEVFTTDFWNNYAAIARDFFPNAVVVADRFHIQRMGTTGLEGVRRLVRKSLPRKERLKLKDDRFVLLKHGSNLCDYEKEVLSTIRTHFPYLAAAYDCKERFYAIWADGNDRDAAGEALTAWRASVPEEMRGHFHEAYNTTATRREHILNYFDHRITNAYTESINRLVKSINRMGRGYSIEVVRAKLLYDTNALAKGTLVERVLATSSIFDDAGDDDGCIGLITASSFRPKARYIEKRVCYGAHIPTLCDKLESGEFD